MTTHRPTRRGEKGAAAVEFALVAPVFLAFIFLILDGGRMIFVRQSLNEVATATARCYALKATGCTSTGAAETWATSRALARDNLVLSVAHVTTATCNSVGNMAQATVTTVWKKGAMTLLPQSVAPGTLSATSCFPNVN